MTSQTPNEQDDRGFGSVADALKQESDRLRKLAETLEARQHTLAEMEANYPHMRQFVYARLREEFERTLGELPDTDLESMAKQEEAQPLEDFIDELERTEGER